jgi:GAF domain-containing protein
LYNADRLIEAFDSLAAQADDFRFLAQGVCTLLRDEFDHYTWVGIYMVEGDELVLATYAGEQDTEHQRIPLGKGICGLAAVEERTVNVPDVNQDPRYLACFVSTRSELVVPIMKEGTVYGEIDIDSDTEDAFGADDERLVETLADKMANWLIEHDEAG